MTNKLRLIVGGAALVAGLWLLSGAHAAPELPKDTLKNVVEADIAQLKSHIKTIADDPSEARRFSPTIKTLSMMLAMYAEATGDEALRAGSLKAAEAAEKLIKVAGKKGNDDAIKAANAEVSKLADKLAHKPGAKPLAPAGLAKIESFSLEEIMSPFRGKTVGGLNIDREIREMIKKPDAPAIEILAARTAVLGEYMLTKPNDKAKVNKANTEKWEKWSKDTLELSKQLTVEAGKKTADTKALTGLLTKLNAKCSDCHNIFRDD